MNNVAHSQQISDHATSAVKNVSTDSKSFNDTFHKFINIITFVDLPIKQKFILFSIGVMFWFFMMFAISVTMNVNINSKIGTIANDIVPVDRVAQKVNRKLQLLHIDSAGLSKTSEVDMLSQTIHVSGERIQDINGFMAALLSGGRIADINRDNGQLIESFSVEAINDVPALKIYLNNLSPLLENMGSTIVSLGALSRNELIKLQDDGVLAGKLREYDNVLIDARKLSREFSANVTKLYTANSTQIVDATQFTFYAFIAVLFIATALLVIFTISISRSIAVPVTAIIRQIRLLGTGKADLSNKIMIRSKDEIGLLSEEFNTLTREINDIVTFKKVIEEDDSLEDVYSRLGRSFSEKCNLHNYLIYEVAGAKNKMRPVQPIILNPKEIFCNEEILDNCELCKVKKTGHTISSMDYPDVCKQFKKGLEKVHLCMPMIVGGKTGGVVQFLFDENNYNEELKYKGMFKAEQFIKESLSVIEAKRLMNTLRESALKDPLTGLYNRRFLQEYTETLVASALRRGKGVGLLMCDLDFFKQVNDLHGHSAGDTVLKETSGLIVRCVRKADFVIRFGGEEFLVILMDINEGEALKTAEKIRETIEKSKIKISDGSITKTISLGISEFPSDTESFWQAIKFADVALYRAKETGRNRSVRFQEDMWSEKGF